MTAAPGAPGSPPTWCSSDKEIVGCSLGSSRLWFTIGGGIINEVYYPRVDIPQIRDLGFIVGDGAGFWVEVKRMWQHDLRARRPRRPGGARSCTATSASSSRCASRPASTATCC